MFSRKLKGYLKQIIYELHPLTKEIDSRVQKKWVVHRSMVSNTWRYCCFRIPKCANSTIAKSLAYYDPDMAYDPTDPRGQIHKANSRWRLLSAQALTPSGLSQKYFLFTFVRNPYSRILSAYLDKIANLEREAYAAKRRNILKFSDADGGLSFAAFIRYLEQRGLYENPHWAPQTAMLPVAVEKIHFVGRVENLDDDLGFVVNRLFGAVAYQGPIIREINRTHSAHKMAQYYDRDLSERVYGLYKADFDAFAYAKDLP